MSSDFNAVYQIMELTQGLVGSGWQFQFKADEIIATKGDNTVSCQNGSSIDVFLDDLCTIDRQEWEEKVMLENQ